MKIFTQDKELKSQLDAAQVEVSELEATITKLEQDAVASSELLAELQEADAEKTASIDALNVELAEMQEANQAINTELSESIAKQEDFDAKVEESAALKVAALGHGEPVEAITETDTKSLYQQYQELKQANPSKAGAFWREHEAAIKASI
jgi:predicted RNase H-like nuclease (RuvC/YqgF family)